MRGRATRAIGVVLAVAFAAAAASGGMTRQANAALPISSPPTLLGPSPFIQTQVDAPFLFQWSAVSPAQVYNVHVLARTALGASSLVGISYELQISDRVDVGEHVLFDTIVDQTSFLFTNETGDTGFTTSQPPNTPLAGGRYYWRVRALFAGSTSPFSPSGTFRLASTGSGPPFHALGIVRLALASPARAQATSLLVATVQNIGNFSEEGATLEFFANGVSLGTATVPALNASVNQTFSVPWTPTEPGLVDLAATLQYADDDVSAHSISENVVVLGAKSTRTAMLGTLEESLGNLTLQNDAGIPVATIVVSSANGFDIRRFVGKRIRIVGLLTASGGDFVLTATGAELAER